MSAHIAQIKTATAAAIQRLGGLEAGLSDARAGLAERPALKAVG